MDEWSVIAYGAFALSAVASLAQFVNWLLRANPRAVIDVGRWSLAGLGISAIAVLLWLAASGRWTLALMLGAFMMPVLTQAAPRWRSVIGPLLGRRGLGSEATAAWPTAPRTRIESTDPVLVENAVAVLKAYLDAAKCTGGGLDLDQPRMSRAEALEILGLEPDAQPDVINKAYARLRQRVDPALGGSRYLARKIIEARETLLRDEFAQ